jgi:hypothetical protein
MTTYALTRASRPTISEGQERIVYLVFEAHGGGPLTLDQLARECESRGYRATFKTNTSVPGPYEQQVHRSVRYHLRNWIKRGFVAKQDG